MRSVKSGGKSRARSARSETALPNFTMAFQPIVDIETGVVYAQEALVRPPGGGSAVDVLGQVGRRSLDAFDQQCRLRAISLAASLGMRGFLHINFLPNANYQPAESVLETLNAAEQAGFPVENLVFEVSESERARDSQHLRAILHEYRRHGMMSAIDDFGAGACGLNLFAGFQPDIVKIDMALTRNIESDRVRLAMTRYVVGLCRELDITVIAEGVETLERGGRAARHRRAALPGVSAGASRARAAAGADRGRRCGDSADASMRLGGAVRCGFRASRRAGSIDGRADKPLRRCRSRPPRPSLPGIR